MVDFKKLRQAKPQQRTVDPIEIFRRLPKPPGINDLYTSQAEVLKSWFERRNQKDVVVKLHTGGGKTLVGLLMAQSIMNETGEPVLYVVPNNQLLAQVCDKARDYGIQASEYDGRQSLTNEVMNGKCVLVCNYQMLFNGRSGTFKLRGAGEALRVAAIVADDAHTAFSTVRDQFTLAVTRKDDETTYSALVTLFRAAFKSLGRLGTLDDVVAKLDYSVLEVPYWSWREQLDAARELLKAKADTDHKFTWPLLRDSLEYCHCLISHDAVSVTPLLPLVDLFPTFEECPRRIFMSATIGDDSAIVRTFAADADSVAKPITSRSLAGVSERMILLPDMMGFGESQMPHLLRQIIKKVQTGERRGVLVLVPSRYAAKPWTDVAAYSDDREKIAGLIRDLQERTIDGPVVLANRYDGIDLPGNACRLLILDGLPSGTSDYDRFLGITLPEGATRASTIAQRVEQGIGRGARGAGDFCVVLLVGRDLIGWIGRTAHAKFLTSSTRAQLEMGREVSRDVDNPTDLFDTISRCLGRDKEWTQYHAETLAESSDEQGRVAVDVRQAETERDAFKLWRDGHPTKAIAKLVDFARDKDKLDRYSVGWLLQVAARMADASGKNDLAISSQKDAYAKNANLLRPPSGIAYERIEKPGEQAEAMVQRITRFRPFRAYLSEFEQAVSALTPDASSNQFEESLRELGAMLGFGAQRPERTFGVGPDVLWILGTDPATGVIIEAKSRKKRTLLNKEDHGQLLTAANWFKEEYPKHERIRVSVIQDAAATVNAIAAGSFALTFPKLHEIVGELRALLEAVIAEEEKHQMVVKCEQLLRKSGLRAEARLKQYLVPFAISAKP